MCFYKCSFEVLSSLHFRQGVTRAAVTQTPPSLVQFPVIVAAALTSVLRT